MPPHGLNEPPGEREVTRRAWAELQRNATHREAKMRKALSDQGEAERVRKAAEAARKAEEAKWKPVCYRSMSHGLLHGQCWEMALRTAEKKY